MSYSQQRPGGNRGAAHIRAAGQDEHHDRSLRDRRDFVAGLRRRRAASWRCAPLPCGRRDPLDPLPTSSADAHELDSWRAAVHHLASHGHDVRWALPRVVAEDLAGAA